MLVNFCLCLLQVHLSCPSLAKSHKNEASLLLNPRLFKEKKKFFRKIRFLVRFSLRSWRYCVGASLKFWQRCRVPKSGSRHEAVASPLVTAPPSNLTRLLHNTASYAGYVRFQAFSAHSHRVN